MKTLSVVEADLAFVVDFGFSGFSAFATAGFEGAAFSRLTIRSARESFSAEIAASRFWITSTCRWASSARSRCVSASVRSPLTCAPTASARVAA